ncbi:MAG: ABC transporter substrate-binding protein [Actinomycetales bacterium]|uniref:ABC transporter substrate-binding protein n=1 Tax=Candidatus Phosphoribacter hodrii TaxID=2953743 RepID=A0A935CEV1_9MICO|nr:ABC transporter substrate-binding protein [Candidatus Phosphoribacter hodrii]
MPRAQSARGIPGARAWTTAPSTARRPRGPADWRGDRRRPRVCRALTSPIERVVSLVPSLTEALAVSAPGLLVGATDWCVHPVSLDVVRVRGTKNPDVPRIAALAPDLVVASMEENREADVTALRELGIPVWVTDIRTVDGALTSIERLLEIVEAPHCGWVAEAREAWREPTQVAGGARLRAVVAIWRRPWMFLGSDTYAGDVLRRLGVDNVLGHSPWRYPRVDFDELPAHDLVILPDEPYRFTPDDGPEAFPGAATALVDGQALTWYGPAWSRRRPCWPNSWACPPPTPASG